jgi:amidohydrolase
MTMLDRAHEIQDQLVSWRREIHQHPELGFRELKTAARVAGVLESLGYQVQTQIGLTGVVGERGHGNPIIALRFDMDALPIQEENGVPYASQVAGTMHACGHDAHTSIGLGVATLLAEESFRGRIRLIFQPAEEIEDEEGYSGADRMLEDGVMEGVEGVIALHVDEKLPVGDIALQVGANSAGVDTFFASVIGRGGHAASPHDVVDPIYITGHILLAIQGIISRKLNPFVPSVISVGSIHGGKADNIIPDRVELSGTIRFMDQKVKEQIHEELERAFTIARTMGGDYSLKIVEGCPPMMNNAGIIEALREVGEEILGEEHLQRPEPCMGAEDFAVFCNVTSGAMFGLGCRLEGDQRQAHNPRFDIDERCLPIGAAMLAETARRLLEGGS